MQDVKQILLDWLHVNGARYLGALAILIVGYLLAKWLGALTSTALSKRAKMDLMVRALLARIVKTIILLIAFIAALNKCGVPTASLIAVLGTAGLAIGLALKDTLTNIAAGIMLLILRPFTVGHAISIGGTVYIIDELGLFLTYAHIPDGPQTTLPNSQVWNAQITNYSITHNDLRRFNETVGISYDDDINKAMAVVQKILDEDTRVLKDPATLVAVSALADSSVNLLIQAWLPRAHWWQFKLDFTKKIKESFDEAGISIPFPQRDIHVYKEKK